METPKSERGKHLLTHATNNDGQLVSINDVKNGKECNCICPACKEPLIARNNGKYRRPHFAHSSGRDCEAAHESMLHLLAKDSIQKKFLSSDFFSLDLFYRSYCINNYSCKYLRKDQIDLVGEGDDCYSCEVKNINLKKYYDSCEQEIPYDNINRRSDLKIFSSKDPNHKPIHIEFCVTHKSDAEKLHSGERIIECVIENEEDIDNIINNGFDPRNEKIKVYGFEDLDFNNTDLNERIAFSRFVLFPSGKTLCYRDSCLCKNLKRKYKDALLEICYHNTSYSEIWKFAKYLGYDKFPIANCILCKNYVDNYNGNGKICRLYKSLQIPKTEKHDTARAKNCPQYSFNNEEYTRTKQAGFDGFYQILE